MRKCTTKLGFGKYKDHELCDVPDEYLEWLIRSNEKQNEAYKAELERRASAEEATMTMVERICKAGYRELSKRLHPDCGGTNAEMQELNATFDAMKKGFK